MKSGAFVIIIALAIFAGGSLRTQSCEYTSLSSSHHSMGECLVDEDLTKAVRTLSVGDQSEIDSSQSLLLKDAEKEPRCRRRVIASLMSAMDKPKLDFERDQNAYYLWRYGASLLGDLKATEALDLLISHLLYSDGQFSSTMVHQPALEGVIRMGPIALPKLSAVLHNKRNRKMRLYSVFCISSIGGESAVRSLREALGSERDLRIAEFIRVSIISLENQHLKITDNVTWYSSFLRSR